MSTKYTVSIKKGVKSEIGGTLKEDVIFTFETPRLYLKNSLPRYGQQFPINEFPIFYAEFDQEIDPSTVLSHISIPGYKPTLVLDGKSSDALKDKIEQLMKDYKLEKRDSNIYHEY